MPPPHIVLGIPSTASQEEVKKAFRRKSFQCHPDLCPPAQRPAAEQAFKEVAEAYAILSGREVTGTPISDWQSRHPRGNSRSWSATRPAARISNAGLALFLCIPLVLTGITLGQKYPRLAQESWRRHGLLNPPTNPFLRDDMLPKQRPWGASRRE